MYLKAIDAAIALGRSALLLVPEIALTPAVAGQFFHRFGDRVAILHSAFHDAERAEQWRRIRAGIATVVVGTRSGVFAPVQNLGLVVIDEEHDAELQAAGDAALQRPRCGHRARARSRRRGGAWLGHAEPRKPLQRRARQVHADQTAGTHRAAAHAGRRSDRHAAGVSGNAQAGDIFAPAGGDHRRAAEERRADHAAAQPARFFELRRVPRLRRARWSASIARSR